MDISTLSFLLLLVLFDWFILTMIFMEWMFEFLYDFLCLPLTCIGTFQNIFFQFYVFQILSGWPCYLNNNQTSALNIQLPLEQHRFEMHKSTYMQIFFDKCSIVHFFSSYDFLSNVLFSLAYFIVRNTVYSTYNIQYV